MRTKLKKFLLIFLLFYFVPSFVRHLSSSSIEDEPGFIGKVVRIEQEYVYIKSLETNEWIDITWGTVYKAKKSPQLKDRSIEFKLNQIVGVTFASPIDSEGYIKVIYAYWEPGDEYITEMVKRGRIVLEE